MKLTINQILMKKVTVVTLFLQFLNTFRVLCKKNILCVCMYIYNTYLVKSSVTL